MIDEWFREPGCAVVDRARGNGRVQSDPDRSDRIGPVLAVTQLSTVEPREIEWLWKDRFPCGMLSVIAGDPSTGKSTLTTDMAARVTAGRPWPDDRGTPNPVGEVIIVPVEDGLADTIRPRIDAAQGDPSKVFVLEGIRRAEVDGIDPICLDRDLRHLDGLLYERPDVRLCIFDPLDAVLGTDTDSHRKSDVQRVLGLVSKLAERHAVAMIGVLHHRKSQSGAGDKALYRVLGSLGFVSAPRAVWQLTRDPKDRARRIMTCLKCNIAPAPSGLAFTIPDAGVIDWEETPITITADEALEQPRSQTARAGACDWLTEVLAVGPMGSESLRTAGDAAGLSWSTLKRAKDDLQVRARKRPDGWYWELSPEVQESQ